jgi:hypothetical protein
MAFTSNGPTFSAVEGDIDISDILRISSVGSYVTTVLNLGSWPYGCVLQTSQRTLVTHGPPGLPP